MGVYSIVYYRRALAREGISFDETLILSQDQRSMFLVQAMNDLRQSITILEMTEQDDRNKMKADCRRALARIQKSSNQVQAIAKEKGSKRSSNGSSQSSSQPPNSNEERQRSVNVDQQKQDIMRLLFGRQLTKERIKGEAFFLINWKWWCHWCNYVDFFYLDGKQSVKSQERTARVLKLLPPGAVLPRTDDGDSDSDDESSQESSLPLGEIDNSSLLMESSTFHKQWYDTSPQTLRPNLIRGYHFELLPREVYNALREWYGELTPSLCRRTTEDGVIVLYDQPSVASP